MEALVSGECSTADAVVQQMKEEGKAPPGMTDTMEQLSRACPVISREISDSAKFNGLSGRRRKSKRKSRRRSRR